MTDRQKTTAANSLLTPKCWAKFLKQTTIR